jgi:ribonuclease BN (tRNA processing enzyme)
VLIGISASCSCLEKKAATKCGLTTVVANSTAVAVFRSGGLAASAVRVFHGAVPALAWRVEVGKVIVFSGDTNGEGEGLVRLAMNADLFIAHNAVPEGALESRGACTCLRL